MPPFASTAVLVQEKISGPGNVSEADEQAERPGLPTAVKAAPGSGDYLLLHMLVARVVGAFFEFIATQVFQVRAC